MAQRGLKFESVTVSFHQVSNIFNFKISRMTAEEIRAHALATEMYALDRDELLPSNSCPEPTMEGPGLGDPLPEVEAGVLDISDVPIQDSQQPEDSPVRDLQPIRESPDLAHRRDVTQSSPSSHDAKASREPSLNQSGRDSGLNSSTGIFIIIIRVLLAINFLVSSSFLYFL